MAEPTGLSIGKYSEGTPHRGNLANRVRGRIYSTNNDVINGISGMEHISNSLLQSKASPGGMPHASPQVMAQMRSNVNMSASPSISSNALHLNKSLSKGNLNTMPDLEYDPWRANQ